MPAQSGETLIGDYVYHVIRDAFGKAIGLVHDGETDKLAIQLEDSTILFLTLSPAYQSLPNKRLEETIKYKLKDLPSKITENIVFKAKSGILYLSGTVESLAERRQVLDFSPRRRTRGCRFLPRPPGSKAAVCQCWHLCEP